MIGILLLNTGTPEKADKKHVAKYLRQFLMDPRVIDLPWAIRWPLIQLLIIPTRAKASTEAYEKIWTETGSPLLVNSLAFKEKLGRFLNNAVQPQKRPSMASALPSSESRRSSSEPHYSENYIIELGMRYGQPNIPSAIEKLKKANCSEWIVIPMFPQYASASTGSAVEAFLKHIAGDWNIPSFTIKNSFYDNPGFIDAYSKIIQKSIPKKTPDFFLFSYHGLPWRHIEKSGCGNKISKAIDCQTLNTPCPAISTANTFCYRAQSYTTSRLLAEKLGLKATQYETAFQSRLGKTPWITPYTDLMLAELIKKGVKNLFVACPSFVADCLETIEEIGMRLKEQWQSLGGEEFTLAPCLNDDDDWVEKFVGLIR